MAKERRSQLVNHILPALGNKRLAELNIIMLDEWFIFIPRANETKNHILSTLNIILNEAQREKFINENPPNYVDRMGKNWVKRDALTLEDINALWPKEENRLLEIWDHPKWATAFYLMLTTGMRTGEAGALRWSDVVWDIPGILILRALKADNQVSPTKNREQRGVVLPQRTIELLKWWHGKTPFREETDYLIHGKWGDKHLNHKTLSVRFRMVIEKQIIDTKERNITAHSLRHTYNTRMRTVLPEAILRFMIGHKSEAMTDRYDQPEPEERLRQLLTKQEIDVNTAWN